MVTTFSSLFSVFERVKQLGETYADYPQLKTELEPIAQEIAQRQGDMAPKIMVYGVYNAGKSTLINALVGRAVAEVDDIPTTDRITPYDWEYQHQHYTLLDSPGIDAPLEHELITNETLDKSDAVIMVVNPTGVADEIKTLTKTVELIKAHKKVIIVLNCRGSLYEKGPAHNVSEDLLKLKDKMLQRMQEIATDKYSAEVINKLPVVWVSAKMACMAQEQTDPARVQMLIRNSNMDECCQMINDVCAATDESAISSRLAHKLALYVDQQLDHLKQEQEQLGCFNDKYHQELLRVFDNNVQLCINEVQKAIDDGARNLSETVRRVMLDRNGQSQDEIKAVQEQVESHIYSVYSRYLDKINQELSQYASAIKSENVHVEMQLQQLCMHPEPIESNFNSSSSSSDAVDELLPVACIALASPARMIPVVGPIVSAGLVALGTILGLRRNNDAARLAEESVRIDREIEWDRLLQAEQERIIKQIEDMANTMRYQFKSVLNDCYQRNFNELDDLRAKIQEQFKDINEQNSRRSDLIVALGQIRAQLED